MAIYKSDIVDINLDGGVIHRSFMKHSIGTADSAADRFGVRVFRGTEEVDLSGCSCYGFFRNSNGDNIALTSNGTVDGSVAYVTLPQACYNYEGPFCLAIKLIGGGVTGTVRIVDGIVDNTNTGDAVAPTGTVPTYTEILSQYDAMVAATATANTQLSLLSDQLYNYNAHDVFAGKVTKANGTHNGVIYTWNGNTCTITGSPSNMSVNTMIADKTALPSDVVPGKKYYVKATSNNAKASLRFIFYDSSNNTLSTLYIQQDTVITVPSAATKWLVQLFTAAALVPPATVTVTAMLNCMTNEELEIAINSGFTGKNTIIPNNTDFDTITDPGVYFFNSGYNYVHSPFSSSYGGTLIVYPASYPGSIVQVAVSYSANGGNSVSKVRMGLNSAFPALWSDIGGNVYNNTYETEYYENTYNIDCSPTILADTNNYLSSTGDSTDRTGDIQAMLNTTGVCHLGPGEFYVTGVEVPNYGALIGSGKKTQIILASSVTNGYAVKLKTYSTVKDMSISGATNVITPSSTVGTRHGILFEGTADAQSSPQTFYRSYITGCLIKNFTGGGITCRNTGLTPSASLVVSDCQIATCGAGVNVSYYSEFHRWTNITAQECYYGCICNGGNNNFANCDFSMNKMALLIDNSANQSRNNSHGTFSACSFHHSDNTYSGGSIVSVGTAIKILKATAGEIFTGCQIGYGNLEIDDSIGIRFDACNFLRMTALKVTDSSLVAFSDCNFWDSTSSPLTQANNTTLKFSDCYLDNGNPFDPMS